MSETKITNKRVKSLFEELSSFTLETDNTKMINNKGEHIFASVLHLFENIEKEYGQEKANMLLKFFMLAIKNKDYNRFKRQLFKINKE